MRMPITKAISMPSRNAIIVVSIIRLFSHCEAILLHAEAIVLVGCSRLLRQEERAARNDGGVVFSSHFSRLTSHGFSLVWLLGQRPITAAWNFAWQTGFSCKRLPGSCSASH